MAYSYRVILSQDTGVLQRSKRIFMLLSPDTDCPFRVKSVSGAEIAEKLGMILL